MSLFQRCGAVDLAPLVADGVTRCLAFDKAGGSRVIFSLFGRDPRRDTIAALYERVATASRAPGLYTGLGIPDTLEGRFEALCLHMVLALRALRGRPDPAPEVAKDLTDAVFRDLDASLREMGVGDTVVPKRMKKLASAFYGRAHAYDAPLDAGDEAALAEALGRNVGGGAEAAQALARYVIAADRRIREADLEAILDRGFDFPATEPFMETP
jgi:cytochrome b pre-mRNA-processing protein 3